MAPFTIDADLNITAHLTPLSRVADETQLIFRSEKELAKISADWPMARFIEIWNAFAGAPPFGGLKMVKKFTDRATAISRIWKTIQALQPAPAEEAAVDAPPPAATAKGKASRKQASPEPKAPKAAKAARGANKSEQVLAMMRRPGGVTLKDIMAATDWQAHTVRGWVAGTVGKKLGIDVESFRNEHKERTYRIAP